MPDAIKAALVAEAKKRHIPLSQLVTEIYANELSKLGYPTNTTEE